MVKAVESRLLKNINENFVAQGLQKSEYIFQK
jgi:hypothetical protein